MLSTIGRAAIRRIGGGSSASTSTNRAALQSLWSLQRADYTQTPRCYATTAAATKTVAKPKATAAAKVKKDPATKAKPKTAAAKTPLKKTALKKAPLKKKKKALVKKPVVKKKKEKVPLTEEEKLKVKLKALKTQALLGKEPKQLPATAWTLIFSEEMKLGGKASAEKISEIAAKYKNLSPSELEAYNHTANQNKITNAQAFKQWVESHTPDTINTANNARRQLRRTVEAKRFIIIQDDRLPKRPTGAMAFFYKERYASGDLKGVGDFKQATELVQNEWKALSEEDKKQFLDAAAADKARYIQEYKTVFGRDSTASLDA